MIMPSFNGGFRRAGEDRTVQQARPVTYHDIGNRLMELGELAWDRHHARALWSTPPHATHGTMRAAAGALRDHGDPEAANLAAAIDRKIGRRTGNAA